MSDNIGFWHVLSYARNRRLDPEFVFDYAVENNSFSDERETLLGAFLTYVKGHFHHSKAQVLQDLFVGFVLGGSADNKTFLEFGATDGVSLSNTHFLEYGLGWTGVLAEPSPRWHHALRKNRPQAVIVTDCVWTVSGETVEFFESQVGELSTIADFRHADAASLPNNADMRNRSGGMIEVRTIALNDLIAQHFDGAVPSYISIDTEGSELEIIRNSDLSKYRPAVFTVEHNHSEAEPAIDDVMAANGYVRVFSKLTAFDAWYVEADVLQALEASVALPRNI